MQYSCLFFPSCFSAKEDVCAIKTAALQGAEWFNLNTSEVVQWTSPTSSTKSKFAQFVRNKPSSTAGPANLYKQYASKLFWVLSNDNRIWVRDIICRYKFKGRRAKEDKISKLFFHFQSACNIGTSLSLLTLVPGISGNLERVSSWEEIIVLSCWETLKVKGGKLSGFVEAPNLSPQCHTLQHVQLYRQLFKQRVSCQHERSRAARAQGGRKQRRNPRKSISITANSIFCLGL